MATKADIDNTRIDYKLIRICLEAIECVAESHGVDFSVLDMDGKKGFLERFGKEVIDICKSQPGGEPFADRVVLWLENEEKGTAGLVFVKRKTNGR